MKIVEDRLIVKDGRIYNIRGEEICEEKLATNDEAADI
jgi:hypothetical protein